MAGIDKDRVKQVVEDILKEASFSVKAKQLEAIYNIIKQKDTLCIFPTSFGKSLIYQVLPLLCKSLATCDNPIVLVVSPLLSLIEDQINQANDLNYLGLTACKIEKKNYDDIRQGKYNMVFGTPEAWLQNNKSNEILSSKFVRANAVCLCVDEVHKVTWGTNLSGETPFREAFGRINEIRAVCKQDLPILALSATVDLDITQLIMTSCNLSSKTKIISTCSDRKNIRLSHLDIKNRANFESLKWLVDLLTLHRERAPKSVIFCRSVNLLGLVYYHITKMIEKELPDSNPKSIVGIFHSKTLEKNKKKVLHSLTNETAMRFVIATSSLGCGVNMKGIKYIVHYGPSYDLTDYCQQVGRGGRNIESFCDAILYTFPQGDKDITKQMKNYVHSASISCLRSMLFTPFNENCEIVQPLTPGHWCCSYCKKKCECGDDQCKLTLPFNNQIQASDLFDTEIKRQVTPESIKTVKECLYEYHNAMCEEVGTLLSGPEFISCVTPKLIEDVIVHLPYIDSVLYILKHIDIVERKLASEIIIIINEVFGEEIAVVGDIDTEVFNLMAMNDFEFLNSPFTTDYNSDMSIDDQ